MNFGEAKAGFLASLKSKKPEENVAKDFEETLSQALDFVAPRFANLALATLTPAELRDTLARWYVEEASTAIVQRTRLPSPGAIRLADVQRLTESLLTFFNWIAERAPGNSAQQLLAILSELQPTLGRALELSVALLTAQANRGGAVQFAEFLTSFEEGGRSEYDVGASATVGAIEGYFRVLRIEGVNVEAEEVISESMVYPIIFPEAVAPLLEPDYLVNLEIVRTPAGWQIVNCGFAYPPQTEI